jgi:hypothetical protein
MPPNLPDLCRDDDHTLIWCILSRPGGSQGEDAQSASPTLNNLLHSPNIT